MPPELLAQFPIAEQAIEALGLVLWPMVEFEADDAIGAAAERFAADPRVERVVDLHAGQGHGPAACATSGSSSGTGGATLTYDDAGVRDEVGRRAREHPRPARRSSATRPTAIPGLPGWGDKSAAAVLREVRPLRVDPGQRQRLGRPGAAQPGRARRRRCATTRPRRCCIATWPACGRPTTGCRSPSRTSTSSSGAAPTAPPGRRSATNGGSRGCAAAPTAGPSCPRTSP